MPRQIRVEYEGAIYHVMARGNRLQNIVSTEEDREVFEQTLQEVIEKTGWLLYAYALMGNHYHLVFKTPEANLVRGMTWFQSTVTKRHNGRNRQRGHLFSGRYKAVLVEENDYLTTLIHYVHLNPVRAKIIKPADGIESYPWSSLGDYLKPPTKRRSWLSARLGLDHLGYKDTAAGRREFLKDTEALIDKDSLVRAGMVPALGASALVNLERGWCYGSEHFREKLSKIMSEIHPEIGSTKSKANGYTGNQINDHSEHTAQACLEQGLPLLGLETKDLPHLKKSDWRKAMLARLIRRNCSVKLDWITKELHMGVRSGVTRAEQLLKLKLKNDKLMQKKWNQIKEMRVFSA